MCPRMSLVIGLAALTAACNINPHGPTPIGLVGPLPSRAVPTARPDTWDSREELAAWINNGVSSGSAVIVGDGSDAVIRIDLPVCSYPCSSFGPFINLHSPAFEPQVNNLRTFRIRYRWLPDGPYGGVHYLHLNIELQVPVLDVYTGPPEMFLVVGDQVGDHKGEWVEEEFTLPFTAKPPFSAESAELIICAYCEHGRLEIDWLALVRQ